MRFHLSIKHWASRVHKMGRNEGHKVPCLVLIEAQVGEYTKEDDIYKS